MMRDKVPTEFKPLGPQLKAYRERRHILWGSLLTAAGPGQDEHLRWTEKAVKPSVSNIEFWHSVMLACHAAGIGDVDTSLCEREQWYTTPEDNRLWAQARAKGRGRAWWWAMRSDKTGRGAWCYVCGELIHRYDIGRGMTRNARYAVMAHRLTHVENLILNEEITELRKFT
jgi:hypothetical protein